MGVGAPTARGAKKALALRMLATLSAAHCGTLVPVSEPTPSPESAAPSAPAAAASVNVGRLVQEAANTSSVLWIELPDGASHPAWFVWDPAGDPLGTGPAAYVVSGPGEQQLPDLPAQVTLILRSKDSGGRLLRIGADVARVTPDSPDWDALVDHLAPARLNAPREVSEAWREGCTIWILSPHGRPIEAPGSYAADAHRVEVLPAPAATVRWQPWHLRGRQRR